MSGSDFRDRGTTLGSQSVLAGTQPEFTGSSGTGMYISVEDNLCSTMPRILSASVSLYETVKIPAVGRRTKYSRYQVLYVFPQAEVSSTKRILVVERPVKQSLNPKEEPQCQDGTLLVQKTFPTDK